MIRMTNVLTGVISGIASGIQSSAIPVAQLLSVVGWAYWLSNPASNPDVGFFFAQSPDGGTTLGPWQTLATSTYSGGSPSAFTAAVLNSNIVASPHLVFLASGTGSNLSTTQLIGLFLATRQGS